MTRISPQELEKLLEESIAYREKESNYTETLGSYASRSASASNLVIVELLNQILDELKKDRVIS